MEIGVLLEKMSDGLVLCMIIGVEGEDRVPSLGHL
jgi:hypothetical protein